MLPDPCAAGVLYENKTTKILNNNRTMPENTSDKGVVMLVLGARSNQCVANAPVVMSPGAELG